MNFSLVHLEMQTPEKCHQAIKSLQTLRNLVYIHRTLMDSFILDGNKTQLIFYVASLSSAY